MVGDAIPLLICKCKIENENDKIIFSPLHEAAADLSEFVEYAWRFRGGLFFLKNRPGSVT